MRKNLHIFVLLLVLGSLAGVAGALWPQFSGRLGGPKTFNQPYTMLNQNADIITNQNFLGKPTLYTFGFTHCPDICPTILSNLTVWLNRLNIQPSELNVVFITVDPERDTPAVLLPYLQAFNPHFVGLTGTPEELKKVAKIFSVYYAKAPDGAGSYTMNHTTSIFMADAAGQFKGVIHYEDDTETALDKIRKLISR